MNILVRDITKKTDPKVICELKVNSNDIIPQVGDKLSHHVKKTGFQGSELHAVRTFDVVRRDFYIGDVNSQRPHLSVDLEVRNDGTEVNS